MPTLIDTYIENRSRVQPNHANNYGTVHGGNVMKWMDEIGAMSAMRFAGESCVTASIDNMDFRNPVPTGDTVAIEAYVHGSGRTSVRTRVRAFRENPRTGEREQTTESQFVFVAVDENGTPTTVPDLTVESDRGERLLRAAKAGENE
ncbi:acyl-CoA thioesterase [Halostella sp. PRR32]|uniref:acyl-CoA thioesterase n=1 Tax=Halostella sp. PRR32 TaxID=3098147 RepID=UPI002B1D0444|nr:acyl-CoA thioesterase [Halostella sp. PRR32]